MWQRQKQVNKELTFHINNMAYTINVTETLEKEITKYLDPKKGNDTRELLAAYIQISQEYSKFKTDIEEISNKLTQI